MKLNTTRRIAITIISAVLLVAILFAFSNEPQGMKNGFARHFQHTRISPVPVFAFDIADCGIAGQNKDAIYCTSSEDNTLLCINKITNRVSKIVLPFPSPRRLIHAYISDTLIQVLDVPAKMLYSFNSSGNLLHIDTLIRSVNKGTPAGAGKFYFKVVDPVSMKPEILFCNLDSGKCNTLSLIKQSIWNNHYFGLDGFFCTDPIKHSVNYVFYYHNTFLALDDKGKLSYKGRTVDTFSITKMASFAKEKGGKKMVTLKSPPRITNKYGCAYDGMLFIASGVSADNEDWSRFDSETTIDVYQGATGVYKYSFYIPSVHKQKSRQFIIDGNHLYAIYKDYVALFLITG